MHHLKSVCLLLSAVAMLTSSARAATVVWSAGIDNGFSSSEGSMVPAGNLVRVGSFNLSDQEIVDNQTDISFLNAAFTEFGTARFGDGAANNAGYFSKTSIADPEPTGLNVVGKQIYVWAFLSGDNSSNAQSLATVIQHGILYMPRTTNSRWAFPSDAIIGGDTTTIDISDLTNPSSTLDPLAKLLVGTFPTGPNGVLNKENFALVVPEPSTAGLLAFGTMLVFRRRRE